VFSSSRCFDVGTCCIDYVLIWVYGKDGVRLHRKGPGSSLSRSLMIPNNEFL